MDIVNTIIVALHLFGLVVGMGSGVALGVLMPAIGKAGEGERDRLFGIGDALMRNAHIGLGLLWITGILVVFFKYDGFAGLSFWFWIKIALVVVLSASIGIGSAAYRRLRSGDKASAARLALTAKINMITGPLVILAAAFAFG